MDSLTVVDQELRPNGSLPYRRIHTSDPQRTLTTQSSEPPRTWKERFKGLGLKSGRHRRGDEDSKDVESVRFQGRTNDLR